MFVWVVVGLMGLGGCLGCGIRLWLGFMGLFVVGLRFVIGLGLFVGLVFGFVYGAYRCHLFWGIAWFVG